MCASEILLEKITFSLAKFRPPRQANQISQSHPRPHQNKKGEGEKKSRGKKKRRARALTFFLFFAEFSDALSKFNEYPQLIENRQ